MLSTPGAAKSPLQLKRLAPVFAALLLAIAGCATVKPPVTEAPAVAVPAGWSAAAPPTDGSRATDLARWWQRFDDPLLAWLVEQALQGNTGVQSAQATLRQARALRDVAAAGLLPSLDGSASAQRSQTGRSSGSNSFHAGLDAGWEPDIFGANRSGLDASQATAAAREASLGAVQVSLAAEVALNYITLRSAQARLAIAGSNLLSQQETLQLTDWRLQAGLVSSLELEQARASTEQTRAQLPALQTTIEQTRHALAVLTGQPPAALAGALAAAAPVPQPPGTLALSLPADTLRQRPDVRAAEQQVLAAWSRVAEADAARLPSLRLGGSIGLNALTLGALGGSAALAGSLLASVSVPLFDGGAGRARVQAQQAALDDARAAYKAAVLVALKEVEDALVALRGDQERALRLGDAALAAANAALLARQRYDSGLIDFQTVLATERTRLAAQDGLASAGADIGADHVRLYKALGGGWQPDTPQPADPMAPTRKAR